MRTVIFVLLAALLVACAAAHGHGNHRPGSRPHGEHGGAGRHEFWQQMKDKFEQVCRADADSLCPDLDLSGERYIKTAFTSECFKANEEQLSPECHQMLRDWREMVSQWHNRPAHPTQPGNSDDQQQPGQFSDPQPGDNSDNDDSDDDDDDNKEEDMKTAFYEACHDDQVALCPDMQGTVSPHDFFKAKCAHQAPGVSDKCKVFFEKWREARMAVFGVLISSTFATMFAGLLACLSICCCVAVCVKRSKARRCRRAARRASAKCAKSAAVAKTTDIEQQQTPVVVSGEDLNNMFAMQTFPAGSAYAPYSVPYPQYWAAQPTMLYAAPSQQVPTSVDEAAKQPIN